MSVNYCFDWHHRQMYTRRRRDAKCDLLRVFNVERLSLFLPMRTFWAVVSREKKWRGRRSPIPLCWRWKVGFSCRQDSTTDMSVSRSKLLWLCTAALGRLGPTMLASAGIVSIMHWGRCWGSTVTAADHDGHKPWWPQTMTMTATHPWRPTWWNLSNDVKWA